MNPKRLFALLVWKYRRYMHVLMIVYYIMVRILVCQHQKLEVFMVCKALRYKIRLVFELEGEPPKKEYMLKSCGTSL
jgi:hypothetical protein